MPLDIGTATKLQMDVMDPVRVDHNEVFVALLFSLTVTAWRMSKPNTEAQRL